MSGSHETGVRRLRLASSGMTLDHECLRSAETKSRAPCPNGSVYWQSPQGMAYKGSIPSNYTDPPCSRFDPSCTAKAHRSMQSSQHAVLRSTMQNFTWRRFTVESPQDFYGGLSAFHYSFYSPFTSVTRIGTSLFCRFAR